MIAGTSGDPSPIIAQAAANGLFGVLLAAAAALVVVILLCVVPSFASRPRRTVRLAFLATACALAVALVPLYSAASRHTAFGIAHLGGARYWVAQAAGGTPPGSRWAVLVAPVLASPEARAAVLDNVERLPDRQVRGRILFRLAYYCSEAASRARNQPPGPHY